MGAGHHQGGGGASCVVRERQWGRSSNNTPSVVAWPWRHDMLLLPRPPQHAMLRLWHVVHMPCLGCGMMGTCARCPCIQPPCQASRCTAPRCPTHPPFASCAAPLTSRLASPAACSAGPAALPGHCAPRCEARKHPAHRGWRGAGLLILAAAAGLLWGLRCVNILLTVDGEARACLLAYCDC